MFDIVYLSSACNRTPHSADWGTSNLICYGTSHSVALYDPKYAGAGKVVSMLCRHKGRVNSVQWVKRNDGVPQMELVSASSDCTAVVWTKVDEYTYYARCLLQGHSSAVTFAAGLYSMRAPQVAVLATASVDSTVKIWKLHEGEEEAACVQTLTFGSGGFCLCLRLTFLPGTDVMLLACAADDAKIHLFGQNTEGMFVRVDTLVGHEDWVRAMDFASDDFGNLLLASSSQESLIRLWKISPCDELVATRARKSVAELRPTEAIEPEEKYFSIEAKDQRLYFSVSLESVLAGHDGWVYGLDWHPRVYSEEKKTYTQPMKLLSSSLDKTIIIWEPDASSGVWLESVRVGEVGGNTLGFYGSKFSPDGQSIMGHGYQGSFHLWSYSQDTQTWEPRVTAGGHFDEVVDMQWEPGGQFLISVGTDQTARIHAPWVRATNQEVTWHELARPQVHGYDMTCLAVLSRYRFASGAEEKVIRTFQAPDNFIENFHRICRIECDKFVSRSDARLPQGASVPSLGLSNKAVYEGEEMPPQDRHVKDEYPESYFTPVSLREPPSEETLLQNTLWPEVHKLYGHGYEVYSLAARHDGLVLASACKATSTQHAAIILWDTLTWKQLQTLEFHQLTVTQMSFSPNGVFLLSVSRDRHWSLFRLEGDDLACKTYKVIDTPNERTRLHSRIIWCCSWMHDSKYYMTGSRDGSVALWNCERLYAAQPSESDNVTGCKVLKLTNQSVTALAAAPRNIAPDTYLTAVGLESGSILLYKWVKHLALDNWVKCLELTNSAMHHLAVKKLAFRPLTEDSSASEDMQLASCGSDHAVKITNIHVNKL